MASKKRLKTPPPRLDLEEMEHDPSMKGMLSFLEISPAEKLEMLRRRAQVDAATVIPFPAPLEVAASKGVSGSTRVETTGVDMTRAVPGGVITTRDEPTRVVMTGVDVTPVDLASPITAPDKTTADITTRVATKTGLQAAGRILQGFITTPVETTPVETTPVEETPVPATPAETTPVEASRLQPPPVVSELQAAPVITTPVITTPVGSGPARPYNVRRAVLVQDGHSHTEQLLYDILWRSAQPEAQGAPCRLVQIPQSELAAAVRMTTKNLRIALGRLVEKLSIDEVRAFDRGTRLARTWRVYSYKAILERRKEAGLEWVVRDKGVRFVDPGTIPVKPTRVVMPEGSETTGVIPTESTPVAEAETTPVKTTSPSLGQSFSTPQKQMSTEAPALVVVRTLMEIFGFIDDDAIQILIRKCRENAPDIRDEEIAELGGLTARRVLRFRNVDNPVGLLIEQTAKCCVGEPFRRYREEKAEQERRIQQLYEGTET